MTKSLIVILQHWVSSGHFRFWFQELYLLQTEACKCSGICWFKFETLFFLTSSFFPLHFFFPQLFFPFFFNVLNTLFLKCCNKLDYTIFVFIVKRQENLLLVFALCVSEEAENSPERKWVLHADITAGFATRDAVFRKTKRSVVSVVVHYYS